MILTAVLLLCSAFSLSETALADMDAGHISNVSKAGKYFEISGLEDMSEMTDEEAAAYVDELIAAIQVQEADPDTNKNCALAKAAWDALTDEQKKLVEEADYFGRDTGDASLDDPRNADEIGQNELLVVSFGTSFNDSRVADIKGIEDALAAAYPDWSVRRAFTAQIIINHVNARDGEVIDNIEDALNRAVANGTENIVIQPTHLMHGAEYDEIAAAAEQFKDLFKSIEIAEPLLGEVGADASEINADKEAVAKAAVAAAMEFEGYDSIEAAAEDGAALVFMGHGTAHTAKVTYSQMQTQMNKLGYDNVFIGTVEGEPEETSCENIIEVVSKAGYTKVILRPLMVVAGDHANNDMADLDDPESWINMFADSDKFESVSAQIEGLGRITAIEDIYVAHAGAAIAKVQEQAAYEQALAEQAAYEQALAEQAAYEQALAEQAAYEQALAEQAAYEQALAEQAAYEQALAEQVVDPGDQGTQGCIGDDGSGAIDPFAE